MIMGVCATVLLLNTHLWNGTCCRTVTMAAALLLISGSMRYEAPLHSCGTSLVEGGGEWFRLVTVRTHGDFYSAVSLGHQATCTMICYPTQSY